MRRSVPVMGLLGRLGALNLGNRPVQIGRAAFVQRRLTLGAPHDTANGTVDVPHPPAGVACGESVALAVELKESH